MLACNTGHLFVPDLENHLSHPFLSLIQLASEAAVEKQVSTVGIIATPATLKTRLYENSLQEAGLEVLELSQPVRDELGAIIRATIAGQDQQLLRAKLIPIIEQLEIRGAEAIIVGCTELSKLLADDTNPKLIDPLTLVVDTVLRRN